MNTLHAKESTRIYGLNDLAVKSAKTAATHLQAASAAGFYQLMHGRPEFINDLYRKLAEEVPALAEGLRVMYANRIVDEFGVGGVRKTDDPKIWAKRPTAFFTFRSKIKADGDKPGFVLVPVKGKWADDNLTEDQVKHIKAARKAIRDAGEDALNMPWKTADKERRDVQALDEKDAKKRISALVKTLAKNAFSINMSRDNLTKMISASGMFDAKETGALLEGFRATKPSPNEAIMDDDIYDLLSDEDKKETTELIKAPAKQAEKKPANNETAHA